MWRRIKASRASRNAAASYLAFFSTAIWGLVTIPIAVKFLEREELGLWTVVNAFLGYLVWMDLGVGTATGRMMADAVAARDQKEINRWWTTTRAVLLVQALVVIVIGLVSIPLILNLLSIPATLVGEAKWILVGGILITGFSLPMRGAPGLLTAQERFHWIPLLQAITPWVNLAVFYALLKAGWGLRSYIWALATSQAVTWLAYHLLVIYGPDRPRFDRDGISRQRFGRLFSLSGNMTISGLVDTLLATLPVMIITRMGGLASVPIYNFSWKGPLLISGLVARTYQSFYPGLQRLHVTDKKQQFQFKHKKVGQLTIGISLISASLVLAGNAMLVQLLAGSSFFVGPVANTWFAAALVTIPLSGYFRILLPISGSLGKNALVSFIKLITGVILGVACWNRFGLAGIAAVFTMVPLFNGVYGYYRGTLCCGFKLHELSRSVALWGIASLAVVALTGYAISQLTPTSLSLQILGRSLQVPSLAHLILASIPGLMGLPHLFRAVRSFRS